MTELETARKHIAELEAELAAMRAVGEPVAYCFPDELLAATENADIFDAWTKRGHGDMPLYTHPQPAAQMNPWLSALEIRMAQGWNLKGDRIPVLYTDSINGEGVGRDDIWLCTTAALSATPLPAQTAAQDAKRHRLPKFLALKFHARRDNKATVTLLFDGHETADAWVHAITAQQGDSNA